MKKVLQAIKLAVAKQNHLSEFNRDLELFYYGKLVSYLRGFLGLSIILFFFTVGARLMHKLIFDKLYNMESVLPDIPIVINEELNTVTVAFYIDELEELRKIGESSDLIRMIFNILLISIVLILLVSLIIFAIRVWLHKKELESMVSELDYPRLINSWEVETIIVDGVTYEVKGIDDEGVLICETLEEGIYE